MYEERWGHVPGLPLRQITKVIKSMATADQTPHMSGHTPCLHCGVLHLQNGNIGETKHTAVGWDTSGVWGKRDWTRPPGPTSTSWRFLSWRRLQTITRTGNLTYREIQLLYAGINVRDRIGFHIAIIFFKLKPDLNFHLNNFVVVVVLQERGLSLRRGQGTNSLLLVRP